MNKITREEFIGPFDDPAKIPELTEPRIINLSPHPQYILMEDGLYIIPQSGFIIRIGKKVKEETELYAKIPDIDNFYLHKYKLNIVDSELYKLSESIMTKTPDIFASSIVGHALLKTGWKGRVYRSTRQRRFVSRYGMTLHLLKYSERDAMSGDIVMTWVKIPDCL